MSERDGTFKWLMVAAMSLLGACGTPADTDVRYEARGAAGAGAVGKADGADDCAALLAALDLREAEAESRWARVVALEAEVAEAGRRARFTLARRAADARAEAEAEDVALVDLSERAAGCEASGSERRNPSAESDFAGVYALADGREGVVYYVVGHEQLARRLADELAEGDGIRAGGAVAVEDQSALKRRAAVIDGETVYIREGYRCVDLGSMDDTTSCTGNCGRSVTVVGDKVVIEYVNNSPTRLRNKQCEPSTNPDDVCIERALPWCRVTTFSDPVCLQKKSSADRMGLLCGR